MASGRVDIEGANVAGVAVGGVPGRLADGGQVVGALAVLGDGVVRRVRYEGAVPQVLVQLRLLLRELQYAVPDLREARVRVMSPATSLSIST